MSETGHDYGLVIKKSDDFFIVDVDPAVYNSGYGVVSKQEDPYGKYDLDDVKAWVLAHPDKIVTEHPLESQIQTIEEIQQEQAELDSVNKELFDRMVQKVFNPEVSVQEEYVPTTEELLTKKAQLEQSIAQLKQSLK